MSMYDRSYCVSECIRKNCERNLKYHKPCSRVYSVSDLGSVGYLNEKDVKHLRCPYFVPDYSEEEEEEEDE